MEGRMSSICSLNARGWRRVLVACYNSILTVGLTKKRVTELLCSFYALKSTSKHFFELLDDEFFNNAIFGYSLKHLKAPHTRHIIRRIIKTEKYSDLIDYLNFCKKWKSDSLFIETYEKSLPIVAQYADSDFMSFYLDCHYFPKLKFSKRTIVTALRRANERNDNNNMLLMLLPTVLSICPRDDATPENLQKLMAVLMEGKKLHFDNEIGFDEKFTRESSIDLIFKLIERKQPAKQLIIPEGDLLYANKLGSALKFKKYYSNFNIKNRSDSSRIIKFRHRNSTQQNEILIRKITQEGPDIYVYAGVRTDNLYQLILQTSLFDKIFGSYLHQFVAVTKESLKLPLEEQPWYFGNTSDTQKFAIASEAPNTSCFFTYSRGDNIYLAWTNTPASQKNRSFIGLRQTVVTDSIEAHLPPNEFILGIYNSQNTIALAEHLACKYVLEGDFENAKRHIIDKNVNLATAFKSPNIITAYLNKYQDKIDNEMVVWLIENNAPIETEAYWGSPTLDKAIAKKYQENILLAILRKVTCASCQLITLIKRGGSYELLKAAYSSHHSKERRYSPSLGPFLNEIALYPTKFPANTHAKKVLVTLAWQFGNNDNYFKVLPRELLNQILEDVEEPEYFQLIDHIIELWGVAKVVDNSQKWQDPALVQFLPYFWKRWDSYFVGSKAALFLMTAICHTGNIALEKYGPILRYWFTKILTSNKFTNKFDIIDSSRLSPMTYYCLTTPNEEALSLLKLLLQHQATTKPRLLQLIQTTKKVNLCYPATWLAVDTGYLPTIKFLLDEDLLPDTINGVELNPKKMSDLYARNSSRRHVKQFMEQYYVNKKR